MDKKGISGRWDAYADREDTRLSQSESVIRWKLDIREARPP